MGDSRSFRDAFSPRNAPARDGLGATPDKFRDKAAGSSKDAFKTAGKPAGPAAPQKSGDAFAPKAKVARPLLGTTLEARPKAGLTQPATPSGAKLGQSKPPKTAPVKRSKIALGKTAPSAPSKPAMVRPAMVKPQKITSPLPPKVPLVPAEENTAKFAKDPFGRKAAKAQRQKALVPAAGAVPSAPMTRPAAKPVASPPLRPGKTQPPKTIFGEQVRQPAPTAFESTAIPEKANAETARAPLQIVANKSVLDHTGFRKFRRAARSSSLVLVSGAAADAIASADPRHEATPDAEADGIATMVADDPDAPVAGKPIEPSPSPAGSTSTTESAATAAGGGDPPPVAPSKPAEPAPPDPAPEAAAAAGAEKPVEVVEATVEPPSSAPYDPASEPVDQLASGPKRKGRAGTAAAVETSWQEVAGNTASEAQPAAAVLRKMETSPVAGYWDGATAGAKSALSKRGFNQDDIFGVVFGIAVLAFMLLWFVRGRGEETPAGDLLATPQSATGQQFAAMPPPAPAPKVDPFGDAPVNLKPTGPIPEAALTSPPVADPQIAAVAPPAATPAPAKPAPVTASPPAVATNPVAAIPVAERKMHAWFCTASSRMTKASRTELKGQMATFEDVFAGKELVVRGYADTRGSSELNVDLGARRAQTVADYLKARGLSVVDVQGVGELNGLDDNQNCPNQRRVDVWVKGGPAETPSRECAPEPEAAALICG